MEKDGKMMNISLRSFVAALVILAVLLALTYVLTLFVPAGSFERTLDAAGSEIIVPGTYASAEGGISFGRFLLSPVLVLLAPGGVTIAAILVFLLVIGGAFNALDAAGVIRYLLGRIHERFASRRYRFLALTCLFFMGLGTLCGSFEECVPMAPIAVAMAYSLGWDALTGLGMSILAAGCGFACGVCNPFTVGVAQELMGLPMFSDAGYRLLCFVVIYAILFLFLRFYAKRIEEKPERSPIYDEARAARWRALREDFAPSRTMDRAVLAFALILGLGVALILSSALIPFLSDIIMPLIALVFFAAGVVSVRLSGAAWRALWKSFGQGMVSILPAILLILLASAVKYTLTESLILDTLLNAAVGLTAGLPLGAVALMMYALVLVMNFFIASGSAKAFLLIPLLASMAGLTGVPYDVVILAFCFGDGFSNVFYPTNAVLLISLGIADVSYGRWARWSIVVQLLILAATCGLLLLRCAL